VEILYPQQLKKMGIKARIKDPGISTNALVNLSGELTRMIKVFEGEIKVLDKFS
jgi:hypothetical protein